MQKLRFGTVLSLTGRYSVQAKESHQGLNLWVKNVNKAGGISIKSQGRRKFGAELRCYDDESSAEKCRKFMEKLILDDDVDILIGPYSSGHTLAVAPLAEKYKRILWNHGGSSDEIFGKGFTYIVSAITPASGYLPGIIDMARELDKEASSIAIFQAEESGFSANVTEGAKKYGEERNFQIRILKYKSAVDELPDLLNDLKKQIPDVILGAGRAEDDILLARLIVEQRIKPKAVGVIAAGINTFRESLGKNADGFLGPSQWEPGIRIKPDFGPTPYDFFIQFKDTYGYEPSYPAAQGYNIGLIVQKCLEESEALNYKALRETAHKIELKTFYGNFKLDPATGNQIGHSMVTVQWQKGRKLIVHPKEMAEAQPLYPDPKFKGQ
ncbi:MAG TPA: amino acid ABC transporter substrate-binding protein [Thermodesulfobacteriota bacterium]|nr:amino acid ABC transporter substrate-binding protein [Thermodesulfobacteriota bacterium]